MKLSDAGTFALALHEGIVPGPYLDSKGVWTYGIGHTAAAGGPNPAKMKRGMPADMDAAIDSVIDLFKVDVAAYVDAVAWAVKVPLKQHQFDALVSFHYNTGAIAKASLTKKLNAGDYAGAGAGLMDWTKDPEVRPRRKAEQDLFLTGAYPGGAVNVWGVSDSGRVIWKPQRRLTMPQFLAMLDPVPTYTADPGHTPKSNPLSPLARLIAALMGMFSRKDKA